MSEQETDIRSIFRSLATNRFLPDLNYVDRKFSFETLMYKTLYSHRSCPCAFQHEYMGYLSDSGEVDETMFEDVLNNIVRGKCVHIDEVDEMYIRQTGIYAIHIAAATGTIDAIRQSANMGFHFRRGDIFRLSPFRAAVLKCQYGAINALKQALPEILARTQVCIGSKAMYLTRTAGPEDAARVDLITSLEYSIRKGDLRLLEHILDPYTLLCDLNKAFEFAFMRDSKHIESLLFGYLETFRRHNDEKYMWLGCITTTIVFNKPDTLRTILKIFRSRSKRGPQFEYFTADLLIFSNALKHFECSGILTEYSVPNCNLAETQDGACPVMKYLLKSWIDYDLGNADVDTLMTTFPCLHKLEDEDNILKVLLQLDLTDVQGFKKLLDTGLQITVEESVTQILNGQWMSISGQYFSPNFRGILELLLYENSDIGSIQASQNIVRNRGFRNDVGMYTFRDINTLTENEFIYKNEYFAGEYIPDSRENTLFGTSNSRYFHLNFVAPMLIECGFPVTKDALEDALTKSLHPAEHDYIRTCLSTPKSLTSACRQILRRHYKRRQIHHFIENSDIPNMIKDYILLKDILPAAGKYL